MIKFVMYTNLHKSKPLLLVLTVMLLASLACNLAGTRRPTLAPIPVSTEAVEQLEKNVQSAAATAVSGGDINLTITEQQLTSAAAYALQAQPDAPIKDIQVHLRNGQMQIGGRAVNQGASVTFSIVLKLSVGANGKLKYEIISAKVGSLSLPQFVIDQITSQVDSVITSQLTVMAGEFIVKQVTINDGYMIIVGSLR